LLHCPTIACGILSLNTFRHRYHTHRSKLHSLSEYHIVCYLETPGATIVRIECSSTLTYSKGLLEVCVQGTPFLNETLSRHSFAYGIEWLYCISRQSSDCGGCPIFHCSDNIAIVRKNSNILLNNNDSPLFNRTELSFVDSIPSNVLIY
jgi:hypothetical protein